MTTAIVELSLLQKPCGVFFSFGQTCVDIECFTRTRFRRLRFATSAHSVRTVRTADHIPCFCCSRHPVFNIDRPSYCNRKLTIRRVPRRMRLVVKNRKYQVYSISQYWTHPSNTSGTLTQRPSGNKKGIYVTFSLRNRLFLTTELSPSNVISR